MNVPVPVPVPGMVSRTAAAHPGRVAVEDDRGALTYGDLVRRAVSGAAVLDRAGPPGAPVCVCLPRGRDFVVAALAAMLSGRPYAPVDLAHPRRRRRAVLDRLGPGTILVSTRSGLTPRDLDRGGKEFRPARARAAYIVHTSGTTGTPKGVLVGHDSLANLVSWHRRTYRTSPRTRQLHTAGLGFDAAVWEIWPCLCAGGTLVVAPDEVRVSPVELVEFGRERAIDILFAPTPLAEMIVELDADDDIPWRTMLTGGDALRLRRLPRGWDLVNHYGPAEATVCATWHPVGRVPDSGLPPIGRPIDGARVVLVDPRGRPTPAGGTGEIHLGGEVLALGYHRDPEETARRFVTLPGLPGRWYRTGDLAAENARGELEFRGRMDDGQLQVHGVRVEAAEIEAALLRHPRVRQAAVATVGDARVLGALVVVSGPCPTAGELRRFMSAELPGSAIPTLVVPGQKIPLTPNGKIDRPGVRRRLAQERRRSGR
ncbi:amino acid adenylation domain-containing protein [Streptosporangium saharense]|uniref:Amino acid adenylation domain-containing protein n=1 Tax=Streptosporangium saharense TaxID=1706840 RepID=A0A7W7QKT7_9ACTN|nr:amino acid adenylation domain-containing protein [Streptosporangium saharense]MBB4915427.1 amino acid adenylation domain-containing protein [Streptosporangium saharense]